MKKLLALLLIAVLMTSGCVFGEGRLKNPEEESTSNESQVLHSDPPPIVMLRDRETFNALRALLSEPDDEILEEYLKNSNENCLENREELTAFFDMIDAFLVPFIPECRLDAVYYSPGDNSRAFVNFWFESETSEGFSFYFRKHHDFEILGSVENTVETTLGITPQLLYEIEGSNIKVYELPYEQDPEFIRFLMDINGYYVQAGYRNDSMKNILEVTPEQIYADLTLGNINDVVWKYKVNGFKFDGNEWQFVEILNDGTEEAFQIEQTYDSSEEQEWE